VPEVIANTSPLQYLFQVGLLDLLPQLYGRVRVPHAVRDELNRGLALGVSLPRLEHLPWVDIVDPVSRALLPLASGLGAGEIQVIALSRETPDHLALLDDRRARRFADLLGVVYTGTLGVLLKARSTDLVGPLAPICDALTRQGFRLSPDTRRGMLDLAGEP